MADDNGHKSCRSHCCGRHGCKYGYDDCPVTMQQLEQDGPCQDCPSLGEIQNELNYWRNEMTWWTILNDRKVKELINKERERLKKEKDAREHHGVEGN